MKKFWFIVADNSPRHFFILLWPGYCYSKGRSLCTQSFPLNLYILFKCTLRLGILALIVYPWHSLYPALLAISGISGYLRYRALPRTGLHHKQTAAISKLSQPSTVDLCKPATNLNIIHLHLMERLNIEITK